MDHRETILRLETYKRELELWKQTRDPATRSRINQNTIWVRGVVFDAGCHVTMTVGPPPAVGGMVMRNLDPFDAIFEPPYGKSVIGVIIDMVDRTIVFSVQGRSRGQLGQPLPSPASASRICT